MHAPRTQVKLRDVQEGCRKKIEEALKQHLEEREPLLLRRCVS